LYNLLPEPESCEPLAVLALDLLNRLQNVDAQSIGKTLSATLPLIRDPEFKQTLEKAIQQKTQS
jgi:hypothetical protein